MAHDDSARDADGPAPGPGLFAAVRHFPVMVLAVVVLGLLVGLGLTFLRDTGYSSTAQVLIGDESDVSVFKDAPGMQPVARAQAAAVAMRSDEVAARASTLLRGSRSAAQVQRATTITPIADAAVVTVTARGETARESADTANAVAKAYGALSGAQAQQVGDRAQAVLKRQQDQLRAEIAQTQTEQDTRAAQVARSLAREPEQSRARVIQLTLTSDATYQALENKASRLSDTLSQLRQSISENLVDTQLASRGTTTLYPAALPPDRFVATLVRNVLVGGVLGLLVGSVLAWRRLERRGTERVRRKRRPVGETARGEGAALSESPAR